MAPSPIAAASSMIATAPTFLAGILSFLVLFDRFAPCRQFRWCEIEYRRAHHETILGFDAALCEPNTPLRRKRDPITLTR